METKVNSLVMFIITSILSDRNQSSDVCDHENISFVKVWLLTLDYRFMRLVEVTSHGKVILKKSYDRKHRLHIPVTLASRY